VVVFSIPDDPHRLRDVIAGELSINSTDAQIQVHGLPGVLPATMKQHDAARLAAAIRDLGVNATAIPAGEVPELHRIDLVHHLRCTDDALKVLGVRGTVTRRIPWENIRLISVGLVPHASRQFQPPVPTVAVSLATAHRGEDPATVRQDSLELLLVSENPLRVLRIDHAEMNYESLGDRMSTSATINFRRLIQALINRAAQACVTPATRSFLEHGLARHYQFRSREEMQRYTTFHLILRDSAWGPQDKRVMPSRLATHS
jgi:hypothetical protein